MHTAAERYNVAKATRRRRRIPLYRILYSFLGSTTSNTVPSDGNDLEAREHVAYGSTIAGITMQLTNTTAQHSMEHAMSAYHHDLPHGAGLSMISKAFAEFFIEKHACDGQFIKMARVMGIPVLWDGDGCLPLLIITVL